jgi:putative methyltransferase (TIGR04325 family)
LIKSLKKIIIPDKWKSALKGLFRKTDPSGWFGDYSSWENAMKECGGYNEGSIAQKIRNSVLKVKNREAVYERDSVIFDELYLFEPVVKALKDSVNGQQLHVLDFGGSLGSSYFQHRHLFEHLKDLKWSVVEQKHYVEIGKKEIAEKELRFYFTIEEALKEQSAHVLVLSSVLQYIPEPYKLIGKLLSYDFDYIIIDRTGFIEREKERITKQIVPENIYKATYPAWFFNEIKFLEAFKGKYNVLSEFINDVPLAMKLNNDKVYWKGFYLKRKHV